MPRTNPRDPRGTQISGRKCVRQLCIAFVHHASPLRHCVRDKRVAGVHGEEQIGQGRTPIPPRIARIEDGALGGVEQVDFGEDFGIGW